jgi:hypothetical protein
MDTEEESMEHEVIQESKSQIAYSQVLGRGVESGHLESNYIICLIQWELGIRKNVHCSCPWFAVSS